MTGRVLDLAYWINEREAMRIEKEKGLPGPWSTNPKMTFVRYCNVHREDDKVTRWIAKNWRDPNAKNPLLTLGMVAARMINWPDTLEGLWFPPGSDGSVAEWFETGKALIRLRQQEGDKAWTSAYTISTCGRPMKKEDYVFDHVLSQVAERSWFASGYDLNGYFRELTSVDVWLSLLPK
jgi:hypothetical protein